MSEALPVHIKTELAKFTVTDAAIAQMKKKYLPLRVNGLEDKQGYADVRAARLHVKAKRVEVEKTRKDLKEDSLKFGRAVDAEAKRIAALLEPIETHLEAEESAIDAEKERLRQEKEALKQKRIHDRLNAINTLGMKFVGAGYEFGELVIFDEQISTMPDEEFTVFCDKVSVAVEAERVRLAEIERQQKEEAERIAKAEEEARLAKEAATRAEEERLAAERARIEEADRKNREKEVALRAEEERIEAEKRSIEEARWREAAEKKRQEELEKAQMEAAEKARIETEEKVKREAEEKAEAERQAKLEAERQEALRPDKEKLVAFAGAIECLKFPTVENEDASDALAGAKDMLLKVSTYLRRKAKDL